MHHTRWAAVVFLCWGASVAWAQQGWPPADFAEDARVVSSGQRYLDQMARQQEELSQLRARLASMETMLQPDVAMSSPSTGSTLRMVPTSRPDLPEGFYASVDWLLWKAYRDGLDFAILQDAATFDSLSGQVESIDMGYNGGVRTHFGYVAPSGWEAGFTYTYFHTSDETFIAAAPGTVINGSPLLSADAGTLPFTHAQGDYSFDMDVIDVELSHWKTFGSSTVVRGFGGLRWALIDQSLLGVYRNVPFDFAAMAWNQQQTTAWGLRLGGEAHLRLTRGFGVFGRLAGSVLGADMDLHHVQVAPPGEEDPTDNHYQALPVLEAACGVSWKYGPVELAGGYEMANWFNLGQTFHYIDDVNDAAYVRTAHDILLGGFFGRLTIAR